MIEVEKHTGASACVYTYQGTTFLSTRCYMIVRESRCRKFYTHRMLPNSQRNSVSLHDYKIISLTQNNSLVSRHTCYRFSVGIQKQTLYIKQWTSICIQITVSDAPNYVVDRFDVTYELRQTRVITIARTYERTTI